MMIGTNDDFIKVRQMKLSLGRFLSKRRFGAWFRPEVVLGH